MRDIPIRFMPRAAALLGVTVLLAAAPALAEKGRGRGGDRDDTHDRARAAVRDGTILPLGEVLQRVAKTVSGRVIEIDLEHEKGMMLYELKMIRPDGTLVEVEVDAATGVIIEIEGDH